MNTSTPINGLRLFSKITCLATLFLIFAGGMVTSTGSGLSVPDWPLSYGTLFPPMVGGIFYEHSHRMIASCVGLMTLMMAIWLARSEKRRWVRNLGFFALGAVVAQGILGGITVLFFLPTCVSVTHAVLAQTFFTLTIIIAYSQSVERKERGEMHSSRSDPVLIRLSMLVIGMIYLQLIIGALMRHTDSGLAIPDFPTMGGMFIPAFDGRMLSTINSWRFDMNLPPVSMGQVFIHFLHRLGAMAVTAAVIIMTLRVLKLSIGDEKLKRLVYLINFFIVLQICLGIFTVLSQKSPVVTSLHVMTGALLLGCNVLLALRALPLTWGELKKSVWAAKTA